MSNVYLASQYNPQTGAFLTRDTVEGQLAYAYCEGNPISNVDPTGHYYRTLLGMKFDLDVLYNAILAQDDYRDTPDDHYYELIDKYSNLKLSYLILKEKIDNINFKSIRHVYYRQGDKRWGKKIYGKNKKYSNYSNAGCGPASVAMVVSTYLQDPNITPDVVGEWSYKHGYRPLGGGSSPRLVAAYAKQWGLKAFSVSVKKAAKYLDMGYRAVVHIYNHYIVLDKNLGYLKNATVIDAKQITIKNRKGKEGQVYVENLIRRYSGNCYNVFDPARRGNGNSDPWTANGLYKQAVGHVCWIITNTSSLPK